MREKSVACRQSLDQLEHFGIFFGLRGCHSANAMFEISEDYYLMRIDTGQCGRIFSVAPAEDPRHIGFGPNETDYVSRRCASLVPVCSVRRLLVEMIGLNLGGGGSLNWLQRSSTLPHRPERSVSLASGQLEQPNNSNLAVRTWNLPSTSCQTL